ncbi:MAG: GNAT family N-acetyltransferase [Planctomycetota bacterium]
MRRTASALRVVTFGPDDRAPFAEGIAALEEGATYPLGDDRFRIDHGADYFAFFDRLGETTFEVALDGDRVVAVVARVLRERPTRCWYLCDLKVHPEYRGQRIAARFARHAFARAYVRCRRGYAISMNDPNQSENRVARLVRRLPIVPFRTGELVLFSLDQREMTEARPIVERHRGPLSFLSLQDCKDIRMESDGRSLPLLHAQFGPCAGGGLEAPLSDHVHMLAAPRSDALAADLVTAGFGPSANATVLHHGMGGTPFDFVLTSDI